MNEYDGSRLNMYLFTPSAPRTHVVKTEHKLNHPWPILLALLGGREYAKLQTIYKK